MPKHEAYITPTIGQAVMVCRAAAACDTTVGIDAKALGTKVRARLTGIVSHLVLDVVCWANLAHFCVLCPRHPRLAVTNIEFVGKLIGWALPLYAHGPGE